MVQGSSSHFAFGLSLIHLNWIFVTGLIWDLWIIPSQMRERYSFKKSTFASLLCMRGTLVSNDIRRLMKRLSKHRQVLCVLLRWYKYWTTKKDSASMLTLVVHCIIGFSLFLSIYVVQPNTPLNIVLRVTWYFMSL